MPATLGRRQAVPRKLLWQSELPRVRRFSAQRNSVPAGQRAADGPGWTRWSTCSESLAVFWPDETARDAAAFRPFTAASRATPNLALMAEGDTPQFRSQRGRLGAYVSWANTENRAVRRMERWRERADAERSLGAAVRDLARTGSNDAPTPRRPAAPPHSLAGDRTQVESR
jgi:hypothetical protein